MEAEAGSRAEAAHVSRGAEPECHATDLGYRDSDSFFKELEQLAIRECPRCLRFALPHPWLEDGHGDLGVTVKLRADIRGDRYPVGLSGRVAEVDCQTG